MTSFEPPSGVDDLEAQAAEIAAERAQMEAEHAKLLRERQQRKVGQDRAALEQRRAELDAELAELDAVPAGAVIEPDGQEVDPGSVPSAMTVIDSEGQEYDINPATGKPYLDEMGNPLPAWPHQTIEFKGRTVQVRMPKPAAAAAIAVLASKHSSLDKSNGAIALFLEKHLSPRSYDELTTAMIDPDDDFSHKDFSQLLQRVATMGTARPTQQSRP